MKAFCLATFLLFFISALSAQEYFGHFKSDCQVGFDEPLIPVYRIDDKNRTMGYIDTAGKVVIPFIYRKALLFNNGMALVQDSTKHYGFIDTAGKVVIPFIYEDVKYIIYKEFHWNYKCEFPEGLLAVKKDNHHMGFSWGMINEKGEEIVPCTYFDVDNFEGGMARIIRAASEAGPTDPFFINTKGKCVKGCTNGG